MTLPNATAPRDQSKYYRMWAMVTLLFVLYSAIVPPIRFGFWPVDHSDSDRGSRGLDNFDYFVDVVRPTPQDLGFLGLLHDTLNCEP